MEKRTFTYIIRWLLLLGLVSILIAAAHLMATLTNSAPETKEGHLKPAHALENRPAVIPSIDAAAPAAFETASFGLG